MVAHTCKKANVWAHRNNWSPPKAIRNNEFLLEGLRYAPARPREVKPKSTNGQLNPNASSHTARERASSVKNNIAVLLQNLSLVLSQGICRERNPRRHIWLPNLPLNCPLSPQRIKLRDGFAVVLTERTMAGHDAVRESLKPALNA